MADINSALHWTTIFSLFFLQHSHFNHISDGDIHSSLTAWAMSGHFLPEVPGMLLWIHLLLCWTAQDRKSISDNVGIQLVRLILRNARCRMSYLNIAIVIFIPEDCGQHGFCNSLPSWLPCKSLYIYTHTYMYVYVNTAVRCQCSFNVLLIVLFFSFTKVQLSSRLIIFITSMIASSLEIKRDAVLVRECNAIMFAEMKWNLNTI